MLGGLVMIPFYGHGQNININTLLSQWSVVTVGNLQAVNDIQGSAYVGGNVNVPGAFNVATGSSSLSKSTVSFAVAGNIQSGGNLQLDGGSVVAGGTINRTINLNSGGISKPNDPAGLPEELHDQYRVDKRQQPTFRQVMRGLDLLKKHGVQFNTLTVVHRANSRQPLAVYRFLQSIGSQFLQFIPLVERAVPDSQPATFAFAEPPIPGQTKNFQSQAPVSDPALGAASSGLGPTVTPWSVEAGQYGNFLCAIFDEWVRHDVGKTFVQLFDVALGNWMGLGSSLCVFAETCGAAMAIETQWRRL